MHQALDNTYAGIPIETVKVKKISAIPQPLSPFNWKVIVETEERYYVRYINIYRKQTRQVSAEDGMLTRVNALYTPKEFYHWTAIDKFGVKPVQQLAKTIWNHERFTTIRHFMQFPAVHEITQLQEGECVWFSDQRFVLGDVRAPFVFGACQHAETKELKFLSWQDGRPAKFDY